MRPSLLRGGLAFGAFAFVAIFGTILSAELPQWRIAAQVAFGLPLAAWAVLRLWRGRRPLDIPIAAALALFAVVALMARDVQGGLEMLGGAVAWALLFWAMSDIRSPTTRAAIALGVVSAVTAWLVVFAVRWIGEKVTWVANGGGVPNLVESTQTLLWLTTNVVPVLVLLGFAFLGYLPSRPASRLLTVLFAGASVVTVPMSGGRAGWLGLVAAGLTLFAFRVARRRTWRADLGGRTAAVAVAGVAAVVLVVVVAGGRALETSGISSRLPLWEQAVSILAADPLTGGGPGSYAWLRLEHVDPLAAPVPAVLAHNVPLQTLSDGGVLMFVGLSAVLAALAHAAWRRRSAMSTADRRTAAVLIGFGAVCLLDDHSSLPAIAAMAVTLAAWLVSPAATSPVTVPTVRRLPAGTVPAVVTAVVAGALMLAVPAVWSADLARVQAASGRQAMLRGDYDAAAEAFDRAIVAYPERPNYHLSAGMAYALAGDVATADSRYRRATELAPADARGWGARAALAVDEDLRHDLAARAAAAPSRDPRYAFALGSLLMADDDSAASAAFARAVIRLPAVIAVIRTQAGDGVADDVAEATANLLERAGMTNRAQGAYVLDELALADDDDVRSLPAAWDAVRLLRAGDREGAEAAAREAIEHARYAASTWEAARALAESECDEQAAEAAIVLATLSPGGRASYRDDLVYVASDLSYREPGLGSYQPIPPPFEGADLRWPDAFLGGVRECQR